MKKLLGISIFLGLVVGLYFLFKTVMWVDAGEIVVVQSVANGNLTVTADPGPMCLCWGSPTTYPFRKQLVYERILSSDGKTVESDNTIPVQFNDGGRAWVAAIVSWEMPRDAPSVIKLHREFSSLDGIDVQLVQPAITKAFVTTASLMSSTESYASRKTEFLYIFEDQLRNGIYRTKTIQVTEADPISGQNKTVSKVELLMGNDGMPVREPSSFGLFKISILPATLNNLIYDGPVEDQIKKQRDAILAVQESQANARRAEQDALTAKSRGDAAAAIARAEQEAIKATEVTQAEKVRDVALLGAQQKRDVAKLDAEAAAFTKQRDITIGEGEAEKKRLAMTADGALDAKLAAYVQVNTVYANAIAQHQGSWVPSVVMGGGTANGTAANGAQQLMEMFSIKAARDLALDLSLPAPVRGPVIPRQASVR